MTDPRELWNEPPDEVYDLRGEACPFPALRSHKKLKQMPPGSLLEILVDRSPAAEESIPDICAENGWPFHCLKEGDYWRLRVRKTG